MFRAADLSLRKQGLILVCVPLALGLGIILVLWLSLETAWVQTHRALKEQEAGAASGLMSTDLFEAVSAFTFFAFTRDLSWERRVKAYQEKAANDYQRAITLPDPEKRQTLMHIHMLVERAFNILDKAMLQIEEGRKFEDSIFSLAGIRQDLSAIMHNIVRDEELLFRDIRADKTDPAAVLSAQIGKLRLCLLIGVFATCLLSAGLAIYLNKGILRRLAVTMENAVRLTTDLPLRPLVEGNDEIAKLDRTFHMMAEILQETARKERSIIDNAVDVICSIDENGLFAKVSLAARNVWSYEPQELIGQSVAAFIAETHADIFNTAIRQSIGNAEPVSFEAPFLRADGNFIYTLWSAHWSSPDKTLFCVSHDISARKLAEDALRRSEARIRLIMESMPVSLLVLNLSGEIELCNSTTEKMFGHSQNELASRQIITLFSDAQESQLFMERAVGHMVESNAIKQSGESFPVELSFTEFETQDGPKMLAIILDISERQEAETIKREFLAMISHDLRTPLTSVKGTLALLEAGALGPLSDSGRHLIGTAGSEVSRLISLVNDLLDVDRLKSGKFELHLDLIRLGQVVKDSVEAVKPIADSRKITIDAPLSDLRVVADGARLIQVLINLLSNAIKFSPTGGLVALTVHEDDTSAEIRVHDQGRGVPLVYQELIFEKYRQVEVSDATQRGGTGLGLAICKAIIEQHGGKIGIESQEGRAGSTFWFRVPKSQAMKLD